MNDDACPTSSELRPCSLESRPIKIRPGTYCIGDSAHASNFTRNASYLTSIKQSKTYCTYTRLAMRRIGHLYPGLSLAAPRVLALQGRDPRTLVGLEYLHTHIRPTAKRQTVGASGRRICFRVEDDMISIGSEVSLFLQLLR